jgi:hypothetical protein
LTDSSLNNHTPHYQRKKALNERLSSYSFRITSWLERLVQQEPQEQQQERLEQQLEQHRQLVLHQQQEQQEQQEQQLV